MGGGDDVQVRQSCELFEVTVRDRASHVGRGHEVTSDVRGECGTPDARRARVCEEYATNSVATCVSGPDDGRMVGNDFRQSCGSMGEFRHEAFVTAKVTAKVGGDAHAVFVVTLQWKLEDGEQTFGSRDTRRHEPQLAKQFLPLVEGTALALDEVAQQS